METKNTINKPYQENITILCNRGGDMLVNVRARSLQNKVTKWKQFDGKWKPAEIEWIEPFKTIFKDAWNSTYGIISLYNKFVSRKEICRFFFLCDMYGIEINCTMKRRGKFTKDEWKLIKEHCKKVEWTKNLNKGLNK